MTLTYLTSAIVMVGLFQIFVTWRLLRGLRRIDRVDARLGHLTEALRLLAETSEAGFKANGQELGRLAERSAAPLTAHPVEAPRSVSTPARPRARRPVASPAPVRRPKAVPAQEMSESEARLRLLLAEKSAASQVAAREAGRGALRA